MNAAKVVSVLKGRFYTMLGVMVFFILTEGPWPSYRGKRLMFKIAQADRPGLLRNALRHFLAQSHIAELVQDYKYLTDNIGKERLSRGDCDVLMGGDDFGGIPEYANYADLKRPDGDVDTVRSQQRGLHLDLVDRAVTEEKKNRQPLVLLEIGTGNGDVLKHLADRHPDVSFIGVDFSVANAKKKHAGTRNIDFRKGYGLDLLDRGDIRPDVAIASSTFMCFYPKELGNYLRALQRAGCRQVVINDISLAGYRQENNHRLDSKYMHQHSWYHNYCGHLRANGFTPVDFEFFHYDHPISWRPDIWISLIRAQASGAPSARDRGDEAGASAVGSEVLSRETRPTALRP